MATKLSFLHIGKANSRITELEAQVATLTKERDDAVTALESNTSEVSESAEKLQSDLLSANTNISTLTAELATVKAAIAAKEKEVADLNATIASKDGEVEIKVARQTLAQQAALGQPAAPAIPEAANPKAKPLFGMERVIAAFKAETDARNARQ